MLGHAHSRRRRHQRRRRGNVERPAAVATGAAGVEQGLAVRDAFNSHSRRAQCFRGVGAHHLGKSHQLIGLLALVAQRGEERHDLLVRHGARKELLHHLASFLAREVRLPVAILRLFLQCSFVVANS